MVARLTNANFTSVLPSTTTGAEPAKGSLGISIDFAACGRNDSRSSFGIPLSSPSLSQGGRRVASMNEATRPLVANGCRGASRLFNSVGMPACRPCPYRRSSSFLGCSIHQGGFQPFAPHCSVTPVANPILPSSRGKICKPIAAVVAEVAYEDL